MNSYLGHRTGEHCIVEEWEPGQTLTKKLRKTGMTIAETVAMGTQIASALSEALLGETG